MVHKVIIHVRFRILSYALHFPLRTNWNHAGIVPSKSLVVLIALSKFITEVRQIDLHSIEKLQPHLLGCLNGRKSPTISGIQTKLYPEHGPITARVSGRQVRGLQIQSGVEISSRAILVSSIGQNPVNISLSKPAFETERAFDKLRLTVGFIFWITFVIN